MQLWHGVKNALLTLALVVVIHIAVVHPALLHDVLVGGRGDGGQDRIAEAADSQDPRADGPPTPGAEPLHTPHSAYFLPVAPRDRPSDRARASLEPAREDSPGVGTSTSLLKYVYKDEKATLDDFLAATLCREGGDSFGDRHDIADVAERNAPHARFGPAAAAAGPVAGPAARGADTRPRQAGGARGARAPCGPEDPVPFSFGSDIGAFAFV